MGMKPCDLCLENSWEFEKLDTKQTIIISHERTIDSFVTDIFNFKKINHVTTVDREN